jgi:hypothetical protein
MKALNTYSCWIHRTNTREDISRHRILISGFPGCSCNGYQLQTASCFVERERQ